MSRNGITYLDVARCAEELTASNEDPTIEGQEKAQLAGQVKQLQSILNNKHRKSRNDKIK